MKNDVITYGFTNEQLSLLMEHIPDGYELTIAECVTDLIVTDAVCTVIVPQNMGEDAVRSLLAYYMDVGDRLDETVVWLGKVELPNLPSFVRCDDFLQLLINCKEIVARAKCRYDIMQQYTDIYSYLPQHAISECLEADVWSAFQKMAKKYPDFYTREDFQEEWMKVLNTENGAELLASVYEFCRWLKMRRIPYRLESACFDLLDWIMGIMDSVSFTDHGEAYTVCILQEHVNIVENWLKNHWYFQKPDERLQIKTVEGLDTGITSLDLQIMGMRPGEVILVGGRPAMGKTSFARGIARHTGKANRVLYMDLEESGIAEMEGVAVLTGSTFSLENILTAATEAKPDLLIVDRLQRITEIIDGGSLQLTMRKLKNLAKALRIPVLITTDLSRDIEERPCPVPFEKDIPAHRLILPYVDTVLLLYRPAYYDPDFDRSMARCIIEKAKRCEPTTLLLRWDDENYRFTD